MPQRKFSGAWMTDIDDTLVYSGEMPDDNKIREIAEFIEVLKSHKVMWVPMSGVAMVKLGPRILNRLPEGILDNVIYYGGDGSLKYVYDMDSSTWVEDTTFSRLFSEPQAYLILGESEYRRAYLESNTDTVDSETVLENKINEIKMKLKAKGYNPEASILDILKAELQKNGVDPGNSEAYFRGGSVSWMMLGDIAADPYHTDENTKLRKRLIEISKEWLEENCNLADLGSTGIHVPFPGARGIKFVLSGNDKERSARNMIEKYSLTPEKVVFSGNELFDGGNDNMIRKIDEVMLLSVGDREDSGPFVFNGRVKDGNTEIVGVDANKYWTKYVIDSLSSGDSWEATLNSMKDMQR